MADVYSFTTTESDPYIGRVADEAQDKTNFIITRERNTVKGNGTTATVLIRKDIFILAALFPTLTIAGRELIEYAEEFFGELAAGNDDGEDFYALTISGPVDALNDELVRVENEIRRIKNIIEGRTVRVNVQSF